MYYKKITGKDIYLSPMDLENEIPLITKWFNEDQDIADNNGFYSDLLTTSKISGLLEDWSKGISFSIIENHSNSFIGHISLFGYKTIEHGATMGIYINKDHRGKGYGKQAIDMLIEYAFNSLNYNFIRLEAFSYNENAIRVYTKAGFKEVGRWRKQKLNKGKLYDIVLMDYLKEEYKEKAHK